MLEILQFVLSSFERFLETMFLIYVTGIAIYYAGLGLRGVPTKECDCGTDD